MVVIKLWLETDEKLICLHLHTDPPLAHSFRRSGVNKARMVHPAQQLLLEQAYLSEHAIKGILSRCTWYSGRSRFITSHTRLSSPYGKCS
jgi:hypothetical protein